MAVRIAFHGKSRGNDGGKARKWESRKCRRSTYQPGHGEQFNEETDALALVDGDPSDLLDLDLIVKR